MELNQDVQYIKGVGPTKVKLLNFYFTFPIYNLYYQKQNVKYC